MESNTNTQNLSLFHRPRRLCRTPSLRRIVQETQLTVNDLIYPVFVMEGEDRQEEIPSMLIEKHDDAWEAIITVGQYYYFQADISVSQFINYIDKYKYSSWLLSNLFHCLDGDNPKTQHYLNFIATTEHGSELLQKQRERELEREFLTELETTTDIDFIKEKAATKNPKFFRAIACNDCTPIEIVKKLSTMKEVKYARQIRINALETLRKK